MSLLKLKRLFNQNDGVTLSFVNCDTMLMCNVAWKELVMYPDELLFFGSPLNVCRDFHRIFQKCKTVSYLFQVARQLYIENCGDVVQCMAVFSSFMMNYNDLNTKHVIELQNKTDCYSNITLKGNLH
mmetsp:Transcript_19752/g.44849  ORF Transcript_19752/g.44849 Transcript_19752/m.44849 type:complete len:127 (-) Transcript_19752:15-395(-)